MSFSHPEEEFLPLDSAVRPSSLPDCMNSFSNPSDSLYDQQNEVTFLMEKIQGLEKNYVSLERTYLKKIKELKEQLAKKHQVQSSLSQQLLNLTRQYQEHKQEIQKVSAEIKSALEQKEEKKQKQQKIKSVSPKNLPNNSPKRLIRKSLETARKQALLQNNQVVSKNNHKPTNKTIQTDKNNDKTVINGQENKGLKNIKLIQQESTRISQQNNINVSNQTKNVRKPLYSPPGQTNGPSPKKKLLFNSSKQLNLFDKPVNEKKGAIFTNNSPSRKLNISPKQSRKIITNPQKKDTIQKEKDNELPVIQQKPVRKAFVKQYESQRITKQGSGSNLHAFSPNQNKKTSSPQNLMKKVSNTNNLNNTKSQQTNETNKDINIKTQRKNDIVSSLVLTEEKQLPIIQKEKKPQSPKGTNKNIKINNDIKFSPPAKKIINNSPLHKKTQSIYESKTTKLLGNIREKFNDNIFK